MAKVTKDTKEFNQKWIHKMNDLSKDLRSFYKGMTIIGICFCIYVGYVVYQSFQEPAIECHKTEYVLKKVLSTTKQGQLFEYMEAKNDPDTEVYWIKNDNPDDNNITYQEKLIKNTEDLFYDYCESNAFDTIISEIAIYPYSAFVNRNRDFEIIDYKECGYDEDGYMIIEIKLEIGKHETIIKLRTKENEKIEDIELIDTGNMETLIQQN